MLTKDPINIGRKVWYWCGEDDYENNAVRDDSQAFDATVVFVNGDNTVNLLVVTHAGTTFAAEDVELHDPQSDNHRAATERYATWMPYQKKQVALAAEKDAQVKQA